MGGDTRSVGKRAAYEAVVEEVRRRVLAGETNAEIAAAIGKSRDAVGHIRSKRLGMGYWRILPLTADQTAALDVAIINGGTTRAIAAEFAVHQGTVARRAKALKAQIRTDLPPCTCGKPHGHGGRCNLIVDPAYVRQRLLDGATATDIAREFDRTLPSFKPRYVQPVVEQLTADGIFCGCGKPFGHPFSCKFTMARQRVSFSEEQRGRARIYCRDGGSIEGLADLLGIALYSARVLASEVRAGLAAEGAICPCGKPIDHAYSCASRERGHRTIVLRRVKYGHAARTMTPFRRRKASRLAREGWGASHISRETGESVWRVEQLMKDLLDAGVTFASICPGCGGEARHKAPCPLPERCACGRWRNHRGPCRQAPERKSAPRTLLSAEQIADLKRRYRNGDSARSIAKGMNVGLHQVQRFLSTWRAKSKYPLKPCLCGRPARHPGGCIKNTPGALHKRWAQRIEDMILAQKTVREIADDLRLGTLAVLKYAAPAREKLLALGVTCPCGLPLGHRYWCSATWDRLDMPRGPIPLEASLERTIRKALILGDPTTVIASATGIGEPTILRIRRDLTPADLKRRRRIMRERTAVTEEDFGKTVFTRITRAVKTGDVAYRDDVRNDIYLAVMEGRIEVDQIEAAAKRMLQREWWDRKRAGPSADEALGDDGGASRADFLEDETFMLSLDEIEIGGDA